MWQRRVHFGTGCDCDGTPVATNDGASTHDDRVPAHHSGGNHHDRRTRCLHDDQFVHDSDDDGASAHDQCTGYHDVGGRGGDE